MPQQPAVAAVAVRPSAVDHAALSFSAMSSPRRMVAACARWFSERLSRSSVFLRAVAKPWGCTSMIVMRRLSMPASRASSASFEGRSRCLSRSTGRLVGCGGLHLRDAVGEPTVARRQLIRVLYAHGLTAARNGARDCVGLWPDTPKIWSGVDATPRRARGRRARHG